MPKHLAGRVVSELDRGQVERAGRAAPAALAEGAVHDHAVDLAAATVEVDGEAVVAGERAVDVAEDLLLAVLEHDVDLPDEAAAAGGLELEGRERALLAADLDLGLAVGRQPESGGEGHR